jgi:hypothetical protein
MFRVHRVQQMLMGNLFRNGQQRGEIRADLAPEDIALVLRQTIFGTLLFWSLSGDASLTERMEQSLNLLLDGIVSRDHSSASQQPQNPFGVAE